MRLHSLFIIVVFLLLSQPPHPTHAQTTCEAVVEDALVFVGDNCTGLGRNQVCYGFRQLEATFFEDFSEAFFAQPSDRTELTALRSITTRPLDLDENEWGIAVLKLQANVPNTLPGQQVTFLLLGNTQLEDATEGTTEQSNAALTATLSRGVTLRKAPADGAGAVSNFPAGTDVLLDVVSQDGAWARASVDERAGWLPIAAVSNDDLSTLPTYDPSTFTPMQSVYFTTGIGQPSCNDAPDLLVVQGPQEFAVNLRVNGADIQLGSTVVFQTPLNGEMRMSVIDGEVILNPGTPNAQTVPPGFLITAPLSAPQPVGVEAAVENRVIMGDWSEPEPIPPEILAQFIVLERFQPDIVNYPITVPQPNVVAAAPECELDPALTVEYIVQPDDTLTSIAQQFNTTVDVLAVGNCLPNPDIIRVAQQINVPPGIPTPIPSATPSGQNIPTPTPTPRPPDDDKDDDNNNAPPPIPVGALNIVDGEDQAVELFQTYSLPMRVETLDADANPIPDLTVTFTVTSGAANFGGAASVTAVTDANGIATSPLLTQTGCPAGSVTVEASVADPLVPPVSFVQNVFNAITVTNGADSGAGSLRQAATNICDNGTIFFDTAVPTVTLTSGNIAFLKNVEIDGGGVVIDTGANGARAFFNNPSYKLTLLNLTINNTSGADAGSNGGLIYNAGTLLLDGVTLLSGNASSGAAAGGAIYNDGGTLTIDNSTISNSTASSGGAVNTVNGTMTVSNSTFANNTADNGGAVFTTNSTVSFDGVSFVDNEAALSGVGDGEVVFTTTLAPTITFANSSITGTLSFADCAGGSLTTFVDAGGNSGGDGTCYP